MPNSNIIFWLISGVTLIFIMKTASASTSNELSGTKRALVFKLEEGGNYTMDKVLIAFEEKCDLNNSPSESTSEILELKQEVDQLRSKIDYLNSKLFLDCMFYSVSFDFSIFPITFILIRCILYLSRVLNNYR